MFCAWNEEKHYSDMESLLAHFPMYLSDEELKLKVITSFFGLKLHF